MTRLTYLSSLTLLAATTAVGCTGAASGQNLSVAAAPPPKDDGKPAQGGTGGSSHSAALEELKIGQLEYRDDKQRSVRVLLPDAGNWMRVKFWGVPSLVGFRYGKEHHAIVGAFITHVDDNAVPGVCMKSFATWANPLLESFDVQLNHDPPGAFMWHREVLDTDSLFAKTATIADHESYAAAYSAYPAWKGACLVVGIAIPSRDDEARAREVRDRFAKEVLPKVEVISKEEPKERY